MIPEPTFHPIPTPPPGLWGFYAALFFVALAVMLVVLHYAEKKARRRVMDANRRLARECEQAMQRREVAR